MTTSTRNLWALAMATLLLLIPLTAQGEEQPGLRGDPAAVAMDSELNTRVRAHSPEHDYWSVTNGEFVKGSEEQLANAMERAPYSIYRLARAVARDDGNLKVPNWATTSGGLVRYEMASLTGSPRRPQLELFAVPEEHAGNGQFE